MNGKVLLRIDGIIKKDEGDYICLVKLGIDFYKLKEEFVDFYVSVSDGKMINCINVGKKKYVLYIFYIVFL